MHGLRIGKLKAMKLQIGFLVFTILAGACAGTSNTLSAAPIPPQGSLKGLAKAVLLVDNRTEVFSLGTATPFLPVEPTPPNPQPVRLTEGGCCSLPMWSQDSQWVLFLDKPGEYYPAGLYGVPIAGGERTVVHERVGVYSRSMTLVAYPEAGRTYVERWADDTRWVIPSQGRIVEFSPSGRSVAWSVGSRSIRYPDVRQSTIWISDYEGENAHEVITVNGGYLIGWEEGEEGIYVTGRLGPSMPSGIWRVDVETGAASLVMEAERPRSALLSPGGSYIAFYVALSSEPEANGLWIVPSDGSPGIKLDLFGAYRWRYDDMLMVIPLEMEAPGISLWQVDAASGEAVQLTYPQLTAISIANNDWQISPDGRRMVYLSAEDRNLWVLRLPNR
jgi:hypothetical protein